MDPGRGENPTSTHVLCAAPVARGRQERESGMGWKRGVLYVTSSQGKKLCCAVFRSRTLRTHTPPVKPSFSPLTLTPPVPTFPTPSLLSFHFPTTTISSTHLYLSLPCPHPFLPRSLLPPLSNHELPHQVTTLTTMRSQPQMVVVGGGSGGRSWSLAAVGIGGVAGYTWWKGWWRFDQVMPVNKAQFNEGIGQLRTKLQVRLLIRSYSAVCELVARSRDLRTGR